MRLPLWASCAIVLAGCARDGVPANDEATSQPAVDAEFAAPVMINAESPVAYPLALYESGIEGTVILRLFADERGVVIVDSTAIAEGSGYPALDSAAVAGVGAMEFAPALRRGEPVATSFLQPVHFRQPENAGTGDAP